MSKILFLRGLPASGKSTYTKELVAKEPDKWIRVNKDSLRKQLHDGKWSKSKEKIVEQMHRAMAEEALKSGLSVIVDDTNFSPRHESTFKQMAERYNAEFEVMEFNTSVEECIERDNKRTDHVGKDVILKMFYQTIKPSFQTGANFAYIFDIDGTLAIMKDRGAYQWDKVDGDEVNTQVAIILRELKKNYNILIVSGRDGICDQQTKKWFSDNNIYYDGFWMRPAGNTEKDVIIKQRIYEEHIKGKYNVLAVFDDRPCVVRFWRCQGLFVFDCGNGVEF